MVGCVVCSKAGRDKGHFMVVVGCTENAVFVCDGKERPLDRPKRKNTKHLAFTKSCLTKEQFSTDRSLRRALAVFCGADESIKEEE